MIGNKKISVNKNQCFWSIFKHVAKNVFSLSKNILYEKPIMHYANNPNVQLFSELKRIVPISPWHIEHVWLKDNVLLLFHLIHKNNTHLFKF